MTIEQLYEKIARVWHVHIDDWTIKQLLKGSGFTFVGHSNRIVVKKGSKVYKLGFSHWDIEQNKSEVKASVLLQNSQFAVYAPKSENINDKIIISEFVKGEHLENLYYNNKVSLFRELETKLEELISDICAAVGLNIYDYHMENIMVDKNNTLKLIDLGKCGFYQ